MKRLLLIAFTLLAAFGIESCSSGRWADAELEKTPVLYLVNTDGATKKNVYAFSIYHEINSMIVWKTKYLTSDKIEIFNFNDQSTDELLMVSFNTEEVVTEVEKEIQILNEYVLNSEKSSGKGVLKIYQEKSSDDEIIAPMALLKSYNVDVFEQEKFKEN